MSISNDQAASRRSADEDNSHDIVWNGAMNVVSKFMQEAVTFTSLFFELWANIISYHLVSPFFLDSQPHLCSLSSLSLAKIEMQQGCKVSFKQRPSCNDQR
jgi:hypothetical protein